jgi:hypothetical protein
MEHFTVALAMGLIRILSGTLEICAGLLMMYFNRPETALKINALLALVGPTAMIVVTALGLAGIASNISLGKMLTIFTGVVLIFYGLNKM